MPQLLASDLNNPEFVGAQNPDSFLHVEFYMHEPVDKWASEAESLKAGRRVTVKKPGGPRPFIRIGNPGDRNSIPEIEVREDHKRRFPEKWLYFQMNEGLIEPGGGVIGWKLQDWPELKDQTDLIRDLNYKRFFTVEQLANASDAQIQGIGIGGLGFREKAKAALRDRVSKDVNDKIAEKDAQLAALQKQMLAMQEQMAALSKPADEPKPRRGRPPKAEAT